MVALPLALSPSPAYPGTYAGTPTPNPTPASRSDDPGVESYVVQPGETLGLIAAVFGCTVEEITSANGLPDADSIRVGQTLIIPVTATQTGPALKLIPDSELVYGPAYIHFDLAGFVAGQGGYLADYAEEVEGRLLTGTEIVQLVSQRFSVGPRVLLALLELQAGWVTDPQPAAETLVYPLGHVQEYYEGLSQQLSWAAVRLNKGYYGWKRGDCATVRLANGNRAAIAPGLNPGTAGVQNCLAGLAVGDAMGCPTEFLTPEQIVAEYGWVEGLVASPTCHPHAALPTGRVTDDTEQAMALAGVYLRDGRMSASAMAQAVLDWADAQGEHLALYLGPSTRRALEVLRAGADPRESGRAGKTNGAAMRVAPVGIVHAGDLEGALADAVEASLPTHGTTLALSAAAAVACAVAEAMRQDATLEEVLEAGMEGAVRGREFGAWVWTPPLEKRFELALRLVRQAENEAQAVRALYDYVGVDMTVTESVPTAFGLVALAEGDPMRAVRYAANIGGDTDTIGAIAGAICGALRGIEAVDGALLAEVERVNGLDLAAVARGLVEIEIPGVGL